MTRCAPAPPRLLPGLLGLGAPGTLFLDHFSGRAVEELRIGQLLIEALELG